MSILAETAGQNASQLLPQLIPIFVEDGDLLVSQMKEALQKGDAGRLQQAAHRLKGNSASLGAMTIAHMTSNLENLGKSGDVTTAVHTFTLLSAEYDNVKAALLALLDQAA
jgi:HPt (histidine-containing phosphotransfer) domain-containing protein